MPIDNNTTSRAHLISGKFPPIGASTTTQTPEATPSMMTNGSIAATASALTALQAQQASGGSAALSLQIASASQSYGEKIARHGSAIVVLNTVQALVDRAVADSAREFVPAFIAIGKALLDLDAGLVANSFKADVLQQLARIHEQYADAASVSWPMPGHSINTDGEPFSLTLDRQLQASQADGFSKAVIAIFEMGPRKLGSKAAPPQVASIKVTTDHIKMQPEVSLGTSVDVVFR